jgi:hypothetical protein
LNSGFGLGDAEIREHNIHFIKIKNKIRNTIIKIMHHGCIIHFINCYEIIAVVAIAVIAVAAICNAGNAA